jgi:hypothetical protein
VGGRGGGVLRGVRKVLKAFFELDGFSFFTATLSLSFQMFFATFYFGFNNFFFAQIMKELKTNWNFG